MEQKDKKENMVPRPPVVVVMGHIDHGKSTLLDYIRKTNIVEKEAGGITQRISAYEVEVPSEEPKSRENRGILRSTQAIGSEAQARRDDSANHRITFLDTPGHEAFSKMRERGAKIADIAILVVSAAEGVKQQTIEAWKTITESNLPYVVAINKIDKPEANIEKTKMDLAEKEIYLEGYGGKVPFTLISAKAGTGVDELLSLVLILAELENFSGNPDIPATGSVIEAHLDPRRGIEATLIVKNGTIKKGMTVAVEDSLCATRMMQNFLGANIDSATFSSPIRLVGFSKMPKVGAEFRAFDKKSEAEEYARAGFGQKPAGKTTESEESNKKIIPLVLKADVWGSLEAIEKEIGRIGAENAEFKIITKGAGAVSESDIKNAGSDVIIVGFNVKADKNATDLALVRGTEIHFFDIIYKLTEWLAGQMEARRPRIETIETTGKAKVVKTFTRTKEKQIVGGKVTEGRITMEGIARIMRRDFEIGKGKIVNLESGKVKTGSVEEGSEFGMMIESKIEIAPGDIIESFTTVQK